MFTLGRDWIELAFVFGFLGGFAGGLEDEAGTEEPLEDASKNYSVFADIYKT